MKLATVGSGAIVDLALDSIKDVKEIERIAAYSRTQEKADEFAKKHGFAKTYTDLDEMFADPDIDTVYIATPNALHYAQAKKALEAGKNVILEKPFASTLEQTEDLFETAEKNGVMIFEAITNVHTPNFGLLKDNLQLAGNIKQALFNFSQYSSRYDNYKKGITANVFDPKMDGGALGDISIYNLHLAHGLFGNPEKLTYLPNIGFNGIDTSGTLILEYPDFTVTAIGSKDTKADYLFQIEGDEGTFEIKDASSGVMKTVEFLPVHPDPEEPVQIISIDQGPHMTYEFLDFAVAIDQQDKEIYNQFKDETLAVAKLYQQAKDQRDAKAKAKGFNL
jgi:predicted dehydrogenase